MNVTDKYVLPEGIMLIPVADLPDAVRTQFESEDGDVAITRPLARTPSKIVDASAATLLDEFKAPSTIVHAVIAFSKKTKADPEQTLVESLPFVMSLIQAGLLLPADSGQAQQIRPTFEVGAQVLDCEIVQVVHLIEDTEIYQVKRKDDTLAALKLARAGANARTRQIFAREAAVLRRLDGGAAPHLFEELDTEEQTYLLMEWCRGVPATVIAEEYRQLPETEGRYKLLELCAKILEAFGYLHSRHVVHGDVHPGNVLVDDDGTVRVIDYGFASWSESEDEPGKRERAGIGFFFEPEYVQAVRAYRRPPPASERGEQYALGALLYLIVTGQHYTDFSLEKEKMLEQIEQEFVLPFSARGISGWAELEAVLARALAKDPAARFSSITEFAAHLRQVQVPEASESLPVKEPAIAVTTPPVAVTTGGVVTAIAAGLALLDEVLGRLDMNGSSYQSPLIAPTASVNHGAAGVAYALYRIAGLRGEASLLTAADLWANRAVRESRQESGFHNAALEMTPELVGPVAMYHTLSGVHCVQALIAHAMGDTTSQQAAVDAFIHTSSSSCENLDLTLGRSSTLIGACLLMDSMRGDGYLQSEGLVQFGNQMMEGIWQELDALPPIRQDGKIRYLGIAHGWAGLCYAALRWSQAANTPVPNGLAERLSELAELAEPAGKGVRWKWELGGKGRANSYSYMPGWCNGSAGFVHLWTLAHQVFGDAQWLALAEKAAWNAWEGHATLANLCCGQSGQAYALLNLYNYTGELDWLVRAQDMTNRAANAIPAERAHLKRYGMSPDGLYKGELGIALLVAEIANPSGARMPMFESEGW